ncbi:MAG TPA: HlyD family efflux transporter periplasmic adaptor subunit [Caulobacteraceae bacterium]
MNAQRLVIVGFAAVALVLAAIIFLAPRLAQPRALSGYVEGEPLYLAAPIAGQLSEVDVQRGQRVTAGQQLFVVDTRTLTAQQDEAGGQIAQAKSGVAAATATLAQLTSQASVASANAAEADREAARAERVLAAGHGAISQQDVDKARAGAQAGHAQLQAALRQAAAARAQIGAASGQLRQAEGVGAGAEARLGQAAPHAPTAAEVEDVFFQTGEWAAANQPVVSLLPDDRVRLRFFVPEREVAHYQLGRKVSFTCDSCGAARGATINYISPRPEFTPPVIYSLQSRDRLVYLVEALPERRAGLTPGLPVDVTPLAATP